MLIMSGDKREFTNGANVMSLSVYCAGALDDAFAVIIEAGGAKIMDGLPLSGLFFNTIAETSEA